MIFGEPLVLKKQDLSWADVIVMAGLASSKRDARTLVKDGSIRESGNGLEMPIKSWMKVLDADSAFDKFPDPLYPEQTYWFLLCRGTKWSMNHIRKIEIDIEAREHDNPS